jgi:hypothetical protein
MLVKSIAAPLSKKQKIYAQTQEACRKNIERAFGVLRAEWKILHVPPRLWKPKEELIDAYDLIKDKNRSQVLCNDLMEHIWELYVMSSGPFARRTCHALTQGAVFCLLVVRSQLQCHTWSCILSLVLGPACNVIQRVVFCIPDVRS